MNAGRDVERLIADWFVEEAVLRAPDRLLEEAGRVVDRTKQRRLGAAWRTLFMSAPFRVVAAAAIGVLLVGGALLMFGRPNDSFGDPPPTPSARPSQAPSAPPSPTATAAPVKALPTGGRLSAGRYLMEMADAPVDVEFTVGYGWTSGGWYVNTDRSSISWWTVPNVYTDACIAELPDPAVGPTVADLITALDEQANTDMSTPVDVVVDGHRGVRVELSPSDNLPDGCVQLTFWSTPDGTPGRGIDLLSDVPGAAAEPVWVLDVDGERVVIVAASATGDEAAALTMADVMDSMTLTKR